MPTFVPNPGKSHEDEAPPQHPVPPEKGINEPPPPDPNPNDSDTPPEGGFTGDEISTDKSDSSDDQLPPAA